MAEITEKELCTRLYDIVKMGRQQRRLGEPNLFAANTLCHFLATSGWLQEDLRIALMKANPDYRQFQVRYNVAGFGDIPEGEYVPKPYMPTMDEVYRFIESNPETTLDMLAEIDGKQHK